MQNKSEIRKYFLERRLEIAAEERKRSGRMIADLIRSLPHYKNAGTVALYYPVRGEVDLLSLLDDKEKTFVFPRVTGEKMAFYPAGSFKEFVTGRFGIPEPSRGNAVQGHDIDLILVPGICFDGNGHRLGYGRGYYDRLIQDNPDVDTIGVCFDECHMDQLPVDPWDVNVDCVVTQTGVFQIRR